MTADNPLLDQLGKFINSAAGAAREARNELGTLVRTQTERLVHDLELVTREEFDAVRTIAMSARAEVKVLRERLAVLEESSSTPVKKMIHSRKTRAIRRRSPIKKYHR